MRTVGLIGVLSVATAAHAAVLSTLKGSFDTPTYQPGTVLADYNDPTLGWSGATAPTITADGKINLYLDRTDPGLAEHAIPSSDSTTGFAVPGSSGRDLCIGFTLSFSANSSNTNVFNVISLNIGRSYLFVTVTKKDAHTISLSLGGQGGIPDGQGNNVSTNTLIIKDTDTIRLILAVTPYTGSSGRRTAYLSDASTLTSGNYSTSSVQRIGISPSMPDDLMIRTTPDFQVTMDDLIVGNSASDVAAPLTVAPVPEPATLMLSLPVAALLLRRKRAQ